MGQNDVRHGMICPLILGGLVNGTELLLVALAGTAV